MKFQTAQGGNVYIDRSQIEDGAVRPDLAQELQRYLEGELTLYRGISRNHHTWHELLGEGRVSPFGTGEQPHFETNRTSMIPFSQNEMIARGVAVGRTNMGPGDDSRFVEGYDPQDPTQPVGALLTLTVGPSQDIGFFNAGEIQVRGPVSPDRVSLFHNGDNVVEALTGMPDDSIETLGSVAPSPPTEAEMRDYIEQYGGLRK